MHNTQTQYTIFCVSYPYSKKLHKNFLHWVFGMVIYQYQYPYTKFWASNSILGMAYNFFDVYNKFWLFIFRKTRVAIFRPNYEIDLFCRQKFSNWKFKKFKFQKILSITLLKKFDLNLSTKYSNRWSGRQKMQPEKKIKIDKYLQNVFWV